MTEIPVLAMLDVGRGDAGGAGAAIAQAIGEPAQIVRGGRPQWAAGALPLLELEGPAVALDGEPGGARAGAARREPPVIARIHDGRVLLDPRTLTDERGAAGGPAAQAAARGMSAQPLTLGTAGHIDHGKTALIRALTGVDTDRLPEERARGISIELGYAQLELPSGRRLSVIDVPGHERFVRTMVAGATGIDLFLMTIAADDGVMPQTREHAAVLGALGVRTGVVAVTKSDLADPDLALIEASELLPDAEAVAVSARTGAGLDELRAALERASASVASRADAGRAGPAARRPGVHDPGRRARWSPARCGRGRSGGATSSSCCPPGRRVRVRGVQVHDQPVDRAPAGQRVAVNLTGIAVDEIDRGDVLVVGPREPAGRRYRVDAELEFRPDAEPEHGDRVQVHHGTREAPARLAWLGGRFWQVRLEQPIVPAAGDRLVVRQIAPPDTLGGGRVLDAQPRRHGPSRDVLARLERLARGEEEPEPTGRARPAPADAERSEAPKAAVELGARARASGSARPGSSRRSTPSSTPATWPRCGTRAARCACRKALHYHADALAEIRARLVEIAQAQRRRGHARAAARRARDLAQVRPGAARALRLREGDDPPRRRARPAAAARLRARRRPPSGRSDPHPRTARCSRARYSSISIGESAERSTTASSEDIVETSSTCSLRNHCRNCSLRKSFSSRATPISSPIWSLTRRSCSSASATGATMSLNSVSGAATPGIVTRASASSR